MSNYFKTLSDCKKEKGEGDSCQYVTKCQHESSKRDVEDAYYTCLADSSGGGSKKRSRRRSKLKKRSRRRSKLKKRSRRRSKLKKRSRRRSKLKKRHS